MNTSSVYNFQQILSNFSIEGDIAEVKPYGSGHINGTFRVKNAHANQPDYLLQRINTHVFKDVEALIQNILIVTNHLRNKLIQAEQPNPEDHVLTLIPTHSESYYYKDDDDNYWRVYLYIKNTKSYDLATTTEQAYQSGMAFGRFQFLLTDLDPSLLAETIPDFHNIDYRLNNLRNAIGNDPLLRVAECQAEIEFITEHIDTMRQIIIMKQDGKLPSRITHNDTKFNNVLLDKNDQAQCIIDLDTVMPGLVAYDFGDAIRTIINITPEDEPDLTKIDLNINLFKAYVDGYLKEAVFLTDYEIESLISGALLLPYMQAVRFLTDFIEGDHYFKTNFQNHNLQRTKAQLQLLKKLLENYDHLRKIIFDTAASYRSSAQNTSIKTNESA